MAGIDKGDRKQEPVPEARVDRAFEEDNHPVEALQNVMGKETVVAGSPQQDSSR